MCAMDALEGKCEYMTKKIRISIDKSNTEYTFEEIARVNGISVARAEQIYLRAMRKIKKLLGGLNEKR